MNRPSTLLCAIALASLVRGMSSQAPGSLDADQAYRQRESLSSAQRAAAIWAERSAVDFESAWKLARACYWLGTHEAQGNRRATLERGVNAGENAIRLASSRPEGHFWLAANMGRLAESFGIIQALKYRGRIRDELERVLAVDPSWQGGSADDALGQWYGTVPRLFGGSPQMAEQHLRAALRHDPSNLSALSFLGEMLLHQKRTAEARVYLQRVLDAAFDAEWAPEDREFKEKAGALLKQIGK